MTEILYQQDDVRMSGSGRKSFAGEKTMKSKKRESLISLGIFTCKIGLVTGFWKL